MNDDPKVGDICMLPDGVTEGVLKDTSEAQDGSQLTCVPKEPMAPAAQEQKAAAPGSETAAAAETVAAAVEPKEGDVCDLDGKAGHLVRLGDGSLSCSIDPVAGDTCMLPDGENGILRTLDDTGKLYCVRLQGY